MDPLTKGTRIGPFRLLFRLGKGGMGEVWAARQTGHGGTERVVALKVLMGAEEGSNSQLMFLDEAKVASALQHPAIVPTYDLGQHGECFYIAMELVRGPSLTALLQQRAARSAPLSPALVAHIGERIASALDYAHERAQIDGKPLRLIHRDVSPHNVLLDQEGLVRLSDFGVARTAVQDHLSRTGTVRGKPSYMAPEHVRGGVIDARSDVFSLGVVLWESACVKRLFGRSNPVKSMDAVVEYQPPRLEDMVPGFPAALADIIERALRKDPAERWPGAEPMRAALLEAMRGLAGSAGVTREVTSLIAESFPEGAFDIDAQVQKAVESTDSGNDEHDSDRTEFFIGARAKRPGPLGPTTAAAGASPASRADPGFAPRPSRLRNQSLGPDEVQPTMIAWPEGGPEDPLEPKAVAELRAQLAAGAGLPKVEAKAARNTGPVPVVTRGQRIPSGLTELSGGRAVKTPAPGSRDPTRKERPPANAAQATPAARSTSGARTPPSPARRPGSTPAGAPLADPATTGSSIALSWSGADRRRRVVVISVMVALLMLSAVGVVIAVRHRDVPQPIPPLADEPALQVSPTAQARPVDLEAPEGEAPSATPPPPPPPRAPSRSPSPKPAATPPSSTSSATRSAPRWRERARPYRAKSLSKPD